MATTYKAIATVTVGSGGAANIEFTSIPGTYTDLLVKISFRSTRAGQIEDGLGFKINTATTGYTYRTLIGDGANVQNLSTSYEQTWAGEINAAGSTASTFSNTEVYLPNYAGSNAKSYSSDSVAENNATNGYSSLQATLQSSTSAVTSITLTAQNGNLAQYSTATLYGIKNS